jgi:hypothetical protein
MASRIFWVALAGLALVAGMVIQDRDWIFGWDDRSIDASIDRSVDRSVDRTVDRTVDRAVDRAVGGMQVIGSDGREMDVTPEAKRALAEAVGRLIKAKADLAVLRVSRASDQEIQAADALADHARADVDRLKAQIEAHEQAAGAQRDALREQIRRDVRENVRDTVREAVRN